MVEHKGQTQSSELIEIQSEESVFEPVTSRLLIG